MNLDKLNCENVGMKDAEVPVLYTLEELFLLSQPLNKRVQQESEVLPQETAISDEPPRKKLKPSRPLKKRNIRIVKQELQEFSNEEGGYPYNAQNDTLRMSSGSRSIQTMEKLDENEEPISREDLIEKQRKELIDKQNLIDDLQQQFVIVQSENLYKDSELKDLQDKLSSHLRTAGDLLKTINSLKLKVDQVKISESSQVKCLELKISQLEAQIRSLKKNGNIEDHTECEKKKKDLLIERLKIFHKLSAEEKLTARLREEVAESELENLNLKKNQEKLDNALKTFENKIKEFTEDKKNLEVAKKEIKSLEAERQDLLKEARKDDDLKKRVYSLEAKVKKYKNLLRKVNTDDENFPDQEKEVDDSEVSSPIIFSNFEETLGITRVQTSVDESLDREKDGTGEVIADESVRSFDARMFQIDEIGNNNEKGGEQDQEKVEEDSDQFSKKEDETVEVAVSMENGITESFDEVSDISIAESSMNSILSDVITSVTEEDLENRSQIKEAVKIQNDASLDEPMFNELVIDLKDDTETNDSEETSDDNLVIDLKDDSSINAVEDVTFELEEERETSFEN